jgi:hypothetical protein
MHMHVMPCDGTFQKVLIRKLVFAGQSVSLLALRRSLLVVFPPTHT